MLWLFIIEWKILGNISAQNILGRNIYFLCFNGLLKWKWKRYIFYTARKYATRILLLFFETVYCYIRSCKVIRGFGVVVEERGRVPRLKKKKKLSRNFTTYWVHTAYKVVVLFYILSVKQIQLLNSTIIHLYEFP